MDDSQSNNEKTFLIHPEMIATKTKTIIIIGLVWQFESFLLASINVFSEFLTNQLCTNIRIFV